MPLTRRQFLEVGAAAAGAGSVGSGLLDNWWGMDPSHAPDPETDGEKVVPTFCEMCFWKCGVLAHVKDGRVNKITGNPKHPLSGGKLCPRGIGGTGLVNDPDRLRRPLVRTGPRGSEQFSPVSWETALDEVAGRLLDLRDKHGPESLALFSHGYGASWFKTLMHAYGTDNLAAPSYAQCRGSRETGFSLTFGAPVGSPETTDLRNSRCIVLVGSHLGENMHNTQVQEFADALDAGARLIVVDPRFSTAAGKADHWLPIRPGTDLALLLAWMHVILSERLYDAEYLAEHAVGLDELKAWVADKTPEWAFVHTGLEPDRIRTTARMMASARPASLIHPGRRTAWYGDDVQRTRAIAILNALLGSWARHGGFYVPSSVAIPKFPLPAWPSHPAEPPDMPPGVVYPFASKVLAHGIRDASIPGTGPYDIKAWMVYGTNLIHALPQPERTREALEALEFMVAIDVLPAEIVGFADVVLPEATYLERYDDLHAPPFRQPFAALRQPVVEPMYDSRPGWWIAKELARRMGLMDWFPWKDPESYLAQRAEAAGLSLEVLKRDGVVLGEREPGTTEEGLIPTFDTPSGKIELFSQQLADAGLAPLPPFTPHEQPGPGEFRLLFGRTPTHTFGRSTNNRVLSEVYDTNQLWMHAGRARELGLEAGQEVRIVNRDGAEAGPVLLKATERIRQDSVFLVHGYGHDAIGLTFARGRGASDAALVTQTAIDPVMGGTGMNVNFVRIEGVTA